VSQAHSHAGQCGRPAAAVCGCLLSGGAVTCVGDGARRSCAFAGAAAFYRRSGAELPCDGGAKYAQRSLVAHGNHRCPPADGLRKLTESPAGMCLRVCLARARVRARAPCAGVRGFPLGFGFRV
jgi:hypothetical protein